MHRIGLLPARRARLTARIGRRDHIVRRLAIKLLVIGVPAAFVLCALSNALAYVAQSNALVAFLVPTMWLGAIAALIYDPARPKALGVATLIVAFATILSMFNQERPYGVSAVFSAELIVLGVLLSMFVGMAAARIADKQSFRALYVLSFVIAGAYVVMQLVVHRHQKNVVGSTALPVAMMVLCSRLARNKEVRPRHIALAAGVVIVVAHVSDHRAMELDGLLFFALAWYLSRPGRRVGRIVAPLVMMLISLGVVYVISRFTEIPLMMQIDEYAKLQTGRTLRSGRDQLWGPLLDGIAQAPLFGYGPATLAEQFTGSTLSAHNAFLQILIRFGYLGTACLLGVVFVVMRRMHTSRSEVAAGILSAYLVSIVFLNTFENVLLFGNTPVAFLTWLQIGMLVDACEAGKGDPVTATSTWSSFRLRAPLPGRQQRRPLAGLARRIESATSRRSIDLGKRGRFDKDRSGR